MKIYYQIKLVVLMLLLTTGAGQAQSEGGEAFSLQQAVDYAMKNSPNALNAKNDIVAAKYRKREIAGIGLPQINASFDLKDFFKIPVSVLPNFVAPAVYQGVITTVNSLPGTDPPMPVDQKLLDPASYPPIAAQFGTKFQAGGNISLSQILFSSDYMVALEAAKYLERMGTLSADRTKAEVVANVSKAYYSVLVNSARLEVLNSNLFRLQNTLREAKAYNEQGLIEIIDVERLEVTYNNLLTEKGNVERFMTLSDAVLRFQMGYTGADPLQLTDKLPEDPDEQEVSLAASDVSKRPEFELLRATHELNYLNLKKEKLGYLPSVVAYGTAGYNAFRTEFDLFERQVEWFPVLMLGGTINLNLFDGLQRHYRIQQAKLEINKTQQNLNLLQQSIGLESNSALVAFNNSIASLKSQARNRELAKHVQEVAQKKYNEGVGSNLEVVTAEAGLREAEANYYNAVYNMLVAKIDYQKAIGALSR